MFLRYRSSKNNERKVIFPRDVIKWRPRGKGEHMVQFDYDVSLKYNKALEEYEEEKD